MRLRKSHLNFGKIANEWARESAPGTLGRDDILLELIRAVWRGEFEDDCQPGEPKSWLTIPNPEVVRGDGAFLDKSRHRTDTPPEILFNRRLLLYTTPPIAGVPLPPKSELGDQESFPWKKLKPSIPFEALAALRLDEYEEYYRRAYLEALTVSKDRFGLWCDDHEHARPAFWFGDVRGKRIQTGPDVAEDTPEATPSGLTQAQQRKGGSRSKHNPWLQDAIGRIVVMLNEEGIPSSARTVWEWLEENALSTRPYDEFEPPIPGCDELYVDDDKLNFTNQAGKKVHYLRRSLDPYVAKAIAENPPKSAE